LSKKSKFKLFKTPIIAGKYKGKQILIPSLDTTRSSKSILRESLFNTIAFDVVDCNFVEMFAGSGSVGLEALSRGAKHSYFIEQNKDVYNLLKENLANISNSDTTALNADAFGIFDTIYKELKAKDEDAIFYFDPPFSIREGMEDIYKKSIDLISKIEDSFVKLVVVEHMTNIDLPATIGKLNLIKSKKFGKSTLSYYSIKD
jgi:16S rRNA (guanine(966)-N(2))-methyltransferase RsmD